MSDTGPEDKSTSVLSLARRCGYAELTPLQAKVIPTILKGKDTVVEDGGAKGKTAAFLMPLLVMLNKQHRGVKAVVLASGHDEVCRTLREFRRFRRSTRLSATTLSEEKSVGKELRQLAAKPDIIIGTPKRVIDHLRRANLRLTGLRSVVILESEENSDPGFRKDVQYIVSKLPRKRQTVIISPSISRDEAGQLYALRSPVFFEKSDFPSYRDEADPEDVEDGDITDPDRTAQENSVSNNKTGNTSPDQKAMEEAIAGILKSIREQEDPEELNALRKVVKKNVPIFMRSYFAAYLFKKSMQGFTKAPREMTTLFVSVGKNRRVYPKDLQKLFMNRLNVRRSDLGDVKVLDSYSFVDINLDHATSAISKLSGINFRGRRLTVNLARKKQES